MRLHIKDDYYTSIDVEDLLRVEGYVKLLSPKADPNKWQLTYSTKGAKRIYYASKTIGGRQGKKWRLHRLIMHLRGFDITNTEVDHKDGDGLNNQFNNLRVATSGQNKINRGARSDSKSGYKGVEFKPHIQKWCAYIVKDGKKTHLGVFMTVRQAALAYNKAAIELWGEYAWTNNIRRVE